MMPSDNRGMGLIRVVVMLVSAAFGLWVVTILIGSMLEPMYSLFRGFNSVEATGLDGTMDWVWTMISTYSIIFFGLVIFALALGFAVYRESMVRTRVR